jgi:hypothetical protein
MLQKENNKLFLYHYYEKEKGPFLSLSDLSDEEAKKVQDVPTFDPSHGDTSEYRQNVYTYDEIKVMIEKYGWPQDEPCTEKTPYWQPRYVEAQVWGDVILK